MPRSHSAPARVASPTNAIVISGLPWDAGSADVCALFSQCDIVERIHPGDHAVKMLIKPNAGDTGGTGQIMGRCVVVLNTAADAEIAIRTLHGLEMGGYWTSGPTIAVQLQ